jgi:hypothetical protein
MMTELKIGTLHLTGWRATAMAMAILFLIAAAPTFVGLLIFGR